VFFIAGDMGAFSDRNPVAYERMGKVHFIASGMGGGLMDNLLFVYVYDDGSVEFNIHPLNEEQPRGLGNLRDW
jgi:hypothetical protein